MQDLAKEETKMLISIKHETQRKMFVDVLLTCLIVNAHCSRVVARAAQRPELS